MIREGISLTGIDQALEVCMLLDVSLRLPTSGQSAAGD